MDRAMSQMSEFRANVTNVAFTRGVYPATAPSAEPGAKDCGFGTESTCCWKPGVAGFGDVFAWEDEEDLCCPRPLSVALSKGIDDREMKNSTVSPYIDSQLVSLLLELPHTVDAISYRGLTSAANSTYRTYFTGPDDMARGCTVRATRCYRANVTALVKSMMPVTLKSRDTPAAAV